MKIINKNIIIFLSVLALVFFAVVNNSNAKVENNISATANTGGNTISGSGTIKTGDAKATVNAQNIVNGGENVQNNVSAEAEGANASVTVNGEEKSCTADAGDSCKVEINNSDNNSNTASSANTTENANVMPKTDTEKNIVQTVASAVSNFAKSVTDKIISWFS